MNGLIAGSYRRRVREEEDQQERRRVVIGGIGGRFRFGLLQNI